MEYLTTTKCVHHKFLSVVTKEKSSVTQLVAIPDDQNFRQKLQALAVIRIHIYIYTWRKLSVNAVEWSLLLQKLLTVLIFPTQISIELKNSRYTRAH